MLGLTALYRHCCGYGIHPHMKRLRQHQSEVNAIIRELHRIPEHRAQHVSHPIEAGDDRFVIGAHPQYFGQPPLRFVYAMLPYVRFSTMCMNMEAEVTPAIEPTQLCSWHGENVISPDAASSAASSRLLAKPSKTSAPVTAPFIGPLIRSHVIGGPACRIVFWSCPAQHESPDRIRSIPAGS